MIKSRNNVIQQIYIRLNERKNISNKILVNKEEKQFFFEHQGPFVSEYLCSRIKKKFL